MILRPYQAEAVHNAIAAIHLSLNPVISSPTGSGKSLILAALCQALPGRLLLVSHVKELLQQNADELSSFDPSQSIGLYSAGLERWDTAHRIIIGGVQSIYRNMHALQHNGAFQYILIDEAHRCPDSGSNEDSMYRQVFTACPAAQRIGLTATPYRLDGGAIYGGKDAWFDCLAHDTNMRALTPTYLAPLRGVLTAHDVPLDGVRTRHGDFALHDLSQMACNERLIEETLDEVCFLAKKRARWLLFAVDVAHTSLITHRLQSRGIASAMVTGETPSEERAATFAAFARGDIRALCGCLVFTTGFNIKAVDCVVVLRPTQSKSLFVQMIGRGSRLSEEKHDCLLLDYGGNIERFSPMDEVWDVHRSPERTTLDAAREATNTQQPHQLTHDKHASRLDPMAEDRLTLTVPCRWVSYEVVPSRNPAHAGTHLLRVTYRLRSLVHKWVTVWVCNEYTGGARFHAAQWFARRQCSMPSTAFEALRQAKTGAYPIPQAVVLRQDGQYVRLLAEHFSLESH